MAKMEWDLANAKERTRDMAKYLEETRDRRIARMTEGCIKTMKKYKPNDKYTETQLLERATRWAIKKDAENTILMLQLEEECIDGPISDLMNL